MVLKPIVSAAMAIGCMVALAQNRRDEELARLLADIKTRQKAVAGIVASPEGQVSVLLSWSEKPPRQVNESELYVGMAEVFGQLKTKAAIPFLIKNISLQRGLPSPNTFMKTPQVIEQRMPAVAALIQIGPDAAKAVMRSFSERSDEGERLATIFVVSRIKGVPEARDFLTSVLGRANMERFWAEEGLKILGDSSSPVR